MMISPEGYYEEYLKGKAKEQIMTAICGLKQEIGRLKNTMESPDYGQEEIVHPSEDTRLHWTREYLERAKQAYAEVGGTYTLSKQKKRLLTLIQTWISSARFFLALAVTLVVIAAM
ncbi:MAG: hypothetical protein KGZ38_08985 [Erysipelothrix sp.]|jgi:hypothetical protein|nr:hypothetical protein [Erysipelothrix sp.]